MIGQGLTSSTIANDLLLSTHTIDTHRENIKRKLGLKNAAELNRHAVQFLLENSVDSASRIAAPLPWMMVVCSPVGVIESDLSLQNKSVSRRTISQFVKGFIDIAHRINFCHGFDLVAGRKFEHLACCRDTSRWRRG